MQYIHKIIQLSSSSYLINDNIIFSFDFSNSYNINIHYYKLQYSFEYIQKIRSEFLNYINNLINIKNITLQDLISINLADTFPKDTMDFATYSKYLELLNKNSFML